MATSKQPRPDRESDADDGMLERAGEAGDDIIGALVGMVVGDGDPSERGEHESWGSPETGPEPGTVTTYPSHHPSGQRPDPCCEELAVGISEIAEYLRILTSNQPVEAEIRSDENLAMKALLESLVRPEWSGVNDLGIVQPKTRPFGSPLKP